MSLSLSSPKAIEPAGSSPTDLAILEFQSPTAAVIAMPVPRVARANIWIFTAVFAALFGVAAFFPYENVVAAYGTVQSSSNTILVNPLNQAIVGALPVKPGQVVKKGQVLAILDPTMASANVESLKNQIALWSAEVARFTAEAKGTPYKPDPANPQSPQEALAYQQDVAQYNAQMQNYNEQIGAMQSQIEGLKAQVVLYRQRLAIARQVSTIWNELLNANVGSKINDLSAEDSETELTRLLASTVAQLAADRQTMTSLAGQRDAFRNQWLGNAENQLDQILPQLAPAVQNLKVAEMNQKLTTLTASQDAVVLSLAAQISVGTVLSPGQGLMTLVPLNSPLVAKVGVAGDFSGYVKPGQAATIKFDTFPYIVYGNAVGRVISITPSSLTVPSDLAVPNTGQSPLPTTGYTLPTGNAQVYYMTDVSIDSLHLRHVPPGTKLMPGMPVTVDINVGQRTLLQYLMEKLLPPFYQGMREPT